MALRIAIALVSMLVMGLSIRRMRMGDLIKVEIPRRLGDPLATGTRMDCAAALNKAGVPREEVARLVDGAHDQDLLDRYWAVRDAATKT